MQQEVTRVTPKPFFQRTDMESSRGSALSRPKTPRHDVASPGRSVPGQDHHTGQHHHCQENRAMLGDRERSPNLSRGLDVVEDGSRSDDSRVGAAAVCKHGNQWRSHISFLGTGPMEVFDAERRTMGLALDMTIMERESLQKACSEAVADLSRFAGCESISGTPRARPGAVVSDADQLESAGTPDPWHCNRD